MTAMNITTLRRSVMVSLLPSVLAGCGSNDTRLMDGELSMSNPGELLERESTRRSRADVFPAAEPPSPDELARMTHYVNNRIDRTKVIKSLRTATGRKIDCLEIAAQPALRGRPLAPVPKVGATGIPPIDRSNGSLPGLAEPLFSATGQPDTCASGTVPVPDIALDDVARFPTLEDFFRKIPHKAPSTNRVGVLPEEYDRDWAVAGRGITNRGAIALINNWRPATAGPGFSLGQVWVSGDGMNGHETVEVGIQRSSTIYGDTQSHFFIYSTRDSYQDAVNPGCYNNLCGDFVQVSSSLFPSMIVTPSVYNGTQYATDVIWFKDGADGHWWLLAFDQQWIGYYSRDLFVAIAEESTHINFGGEVAFLTGQSTHTSTDMGSGKYPYFGFGKAAWIDWLQFFDLSNSAHQIIDLVDLVNSRPGCYYAEVLQGSMNTQVWYGGPGYPGNTMGPCLP